MRIRGKLAVLAIALPLFAGVAACGELQEAQQGVEDAQQGVENAQQGLETAQNCAKATGAVNFVPNFSDQQQVREQARSKAEEIGQLAEQTSDQALSDALRDVQQSMQRVSSGEVTIENSAEWTQHKLEQTERVLNICSGMTGN
ncbi:hypothetical protein CDG81_19245 [Actinopolyspora erythraea]|uniref:Uncharacterized protein n=2 Tax=Actinopolyspora erythraea TaxID=414996 RepID=A0A099D7U6_9ACTN|nr:hypothetical protein CDG81_19245 [Actinopolyspora erythraea]KGI82228.1 hypothetical protein IL38_05655 [Actinopolyspora erythraea]